LAQQGLKVSLIDLASYKSGGSPMRTNQLMPTPLAVSQLVNDFAYGDLAIPEIQRDVVWKPDQVKELISSVFRQYPCGSLILWEPRLRDGNTIRSMIRPERLEQYNGRLPKWFLLDGQQRITALASAFLPPDQLKEILAELAEDMPQIFCNLRRFPDELEATTDVSGYSFPWAPLQVTLCGNVLHDEETRRKLGDAKIREIQERIQRFRDYHFPAQIIRERTYQEVARIFELVNSQGTSLTGAEIHLARLVPHWPGITKDFRDYRSELKERKYDLDLSFLMRSIAAIECDSAQISKLTKKMENQGLSKAGLKRAWRQARRAIDRVVTTLSAELDLDRARYFPSKNVLIPLVYYAANEKSQTRATKQMLRFFLGSQLSERYGRAADTVFREDFRILTDTSKTPRQNLEYLAKCIVVDARRNYRGLKIQPGDVYGPPAKNVILLLMYIVMRRQVATDWSEGRATLLRDIEPKEMQIHHIFPYNFMIKDKDALDYADRCGLKPSEYRSELNDIANMTFLSKPTNVRIGDLPPWQYLPLETSKGIRRAHFIPEDQELWHPSRFGDFLKARRELIAKAATKLLRSLR
jgi:hypothetical protein